MDDAIASPTALIRRGLNYVKAQYSGAEDAWYWRAGKRWYEDGSTHPRDTDGDPA